MSLFVGLAPGLVGGRNRSVGYNSIWDSITTGTPYLAYDVNVEATRTVVAGRLDTISPLYGGGASDVMRVWLSDTPQFNATDVQFGGLSSAQKLAVNGSGESLRSGTAASLLVSQPFWVIGVFVPGTASNHQFFHAASNTAGQDGFLNQQFVGNFGVDMNGTTRDLGVSRDSSQGCLLAILVNGVSTAGFIRKADGTENTTSAILTPGTGGWRGFRLFDAAATDNIKAMAWGLYQTDLSVGDLTALRTWCQTNMGWS